MRLAAQKKRGLVTTDYILDETVTLRRPPRCDSLQAR
jgi:hypothetical protein